MRNRLLLAMFLVLVGPAWAQDGAVLQPHPLDSLGGNMIRCVSGVPLLLIAGGSAATWGLVRSDVDADVSRAVSRQGVVLNAALGTPGAAVGTLAPVILPASLYWFQSNERLQGSGAVAMQAAGLAFVYNNLLKAVTSRAPPRPDDPDPETRSRDFQFGFLRRGVFYGWPSGHTMVNTAMATSLWAYHRDESWAMPAALTYSCAIGASMTLVGRGSAHWASEAVAGLMIGAGVGWTVGDSYYRAQAGLRERGHGASQVTVVPWLEEKTGAMAIYSF